MSYLTALEKNYKELEKIIAEKKNPIYHLTQLWYDCRALIAAKCTSREYFESILKDEKNATERALIQDEIGIQLREQGKVDELSDSVKEAMDSIRPHFKPIIHVKTLTGPAKDFKKGGISKYRAASILIGCFYLIGSKCEGFEYLEDILKYHKDTETQALVFAEMATQKQQTKELEDLFLSVQNSTGTLANNKIIEFIFKK